MNNYNHKYIRTWAKEQGIPMPKHLLIAPLIKGAEGSYIITAFRIYPEGGEVRVAYLDRLMATARRLGFFATETYRDEIGVSVFVDFVGNATEIRKQRIESS